MNKETKMNKKMKTNKETVSFYKLEPGEVFAFEGDDYMKIETIDRCLDYAVSLTTFRLTYFHPSEPGITPLE